MCCCCASSSGRRPARSAEALGISEDAAEKRITRAVEKLRDFFQRRGVDGVARRADDDARGQLRGGRAGRVDRVDRRGVGRFGGHVVRAPRVTATSIAKGTVLAMASAKTKTVLVAACALLLRRRRSGRR